MGRGRQCVKRKVVKVMRHLSCIISTTLLAMALLAISPTLADVQSPAELSGKSSATKETSLGDLVADAVSHAVETPLAFVPAGSFKEASVPAGVVTAERVAECLQYPDDKLAVMELSGLDLRKALERSVSVYPHRNLGFLQVSGIEFEFNPKSPRGSRITSIKVSGRILDNGATYRVGMTRPLAEGQYGYFTIWGKDRKPEVKDRTTAQAVTGFLSGKDSVDYRKLERIRALNGAPNPARGG